MIRVLAVVLSVGMLVSSFGVSSRAAGDTDGQIRIVSPVEGATIKGDSVEVRYELAKGIHATHVHCYVDGEYQKGFSGVVKGLTRGRHEIKVVAANHDHETMAAVAMVTVEVE